MIEILCVLLGLAIGAAVTYFILNRRLTDLRVKDETKGRELELLRQQHAAETDLRQQQFNEQLSLRQQQFDEQQTLRQQQFDEQLNVVREQFQNLATTVLSKTSDQLRQQNREAMEHVTKPISDNFAELQKAIQESDRESAKTAASLTERLRQLGELHQRQGHDR